VSFQPVSYSVNVRELAVSETKDAAAIRYLCKADAFRALGRILGEEGSGRRIGKFSESSSFEMLGVMLDCSRNGVITTGALKSLLRRFALMGINVTMLYTEDTYEVPGQSFFGYLRGRYTREELREVDEYADNLGIEMFPCIQALGHLPQILQWQEAFRDVTDTTTILLAGEEKTYRLLEDMISAVSQPYRSKRIHLGMDESDALGTGNYRKRHGERRAFDILNEHLSRVCEICGRLGLKPMIWSDMYFRFGSKTGDYYDLKAKIPQDVADNIPKDVELVYWDYYHLDDAFYAKYIDLHRRIGKEPIMAPGAWSSLGFWADLPLAYSTIKPCMAASRDKKVREAFICAWGDNGMENDIFSILPAVQFFAESAFSDRVDRKVLTDNFRGSCQTDISAYELASEIDLLKYLKKPEGAVANPSKWLLWDDPLIGLCEPQQDGLSFRKHYAELSGDLRKAAAKNPSMNRLVFPAQIATVLAIKCDCRKNLVAAYKARNKKELRRLLKKEVRPLLKEVKKLWLTHRKLWLDTYKPFGLEVIEIRYGGLILRLQELIMRLEQYLAGKVIGIPEFETELLRFVDPAAVEPYYIGSYQRISTPSAIP
ncbi:MAG: beta-N-acetylhexosaminidase, partial [Chloroflexi bacterium]|nr:beta-N-acetylhexosaminidase [Chloroflexota bacterium]